MSQRVCPWWLGYFLISPFRRLLQNPSTILAPWVREGMVVLEPGPGMGFFTMELARIVGPNGKVIAIDVQPRMLAGLEKRAKRANLAEMIETRLANGESLGIDDLNAKVDFILAFAVVHELPNVSSFFAQAHRALKLGGKLLLSEPKHHVPERTLLDQVELAEKHGFAVVSRPHIRSSHSILLARAN